jgi:hypothetical protein|tara:strand:+ start:2220 stop:3062 length:843 start_codon:yes stop_codon:yes gene_type:complete
MEDNQSVQTYQGDGVNQAGSPEHINEMLAKVDAPLDTADVGTVQQENIPTLEGRPSWLPDKFESPEQMARAYSELETQFHNSNNPTLESIEQQAQEQQQAQEIINTPAHQVHQLLDEQGLDFAEFQKEYNEKGALSEDAYAALNEVGIQPGMVDTWIQGQEAVAQQSIDQIYETAGGEQAYNTMLDWAADNLQPWEMDTFNNQIENLDSNSMFAVQGLQARMQNQEGSAPVLLQGQPSVFSAPKYESSAQLTEAMKDARYASDPAYRTQVAQRLKNSALF